MSLTPLAVLTTIPNPDLHRLDGKIVLVKFASCDANFPVALRGTIEVGEPESPDHAPAVKLVLVFPDMFNVPAYQRVLVLEGERLQRLLASERDGTFEFTIEREFEATEDSGHFKAKA